MSRAFIFKGKENELPVSQKMNTDPFDGYYGDGIIEPPYNLDWLARLPEHSNMLGQCIEAMETNIIIAMCDVRCAIIHEHTHHVKLICVKNLCEF